MTLTTIIALSGAMLLLALIPGPGVLAITAKSMKDGFGQGALMLAGILCADYLFIFMSMAGLLALAQLLGGFFVLLKYFGAAYLLWLAFSIWREPVDNVKAAGVKPGSAFLSGFLVTLGNPKAILFYVGFFPAFLDMKSITAVDISIIYLFTTISIGGVTLGYAFLASHAGRLLLQSKLRKRFNYAAASVMGGSGIALLFRE